MLDEEIIEKINALKKKRHAVMLAHNYQLPEVQDIADFTGDSLSLSAAAATTTPQVIVFCGVHFMAETAKLFCRRRRRCCCRRSRPAAPWPT